MFNPGYPNEIVEGARRVAHQSKFKREHDNNAINGMIERAEAIADGRAPLKTGPVPQEHGGHQRPDRTAAGVPSESLSSVAGR
jgi:hypothetical protein